MEKVIPPKIDIGDIEAFADKALLDLRADETVYNTIKLLNLTNKEVRDHLSFFLDYQEDFHYCENCPGIEACSKPYKHFQLRLSHDGKFVERSFAPCAKIIKKWEQDSQYAVSDFPLAWREAYFANVDMTAERQKVIMAADEIIEKKTKRWIYLTGKPRLGKSYLTVAIVNELIRSGQRPVAFLDTPQRLRQMNDQAFADKDKFKKTFELYANIPVLVFDDFGNEYKNDYIRDTILFPILSERSKKGLLTLFTSDFTISDIGGMYATTKAASIRAKQLTGLLESMCRQELTLAGVSLY